VENRPQTRRYVEDWTLWQRNGVDSAWTAKQWSHFDGAYRHGFRNSVAILRDTGRLGPDVSLEGDAEVVDSTHLVYRHKQADRPVCIP
jgi:hypothetical protein